MVWFVDLGGLRCSEEKKMMLYVRIKFVFELVHY